MTVLLANKSYYVIYFYCMMHNLLSICKNIYDMYCLVFRQIEKVGIDKEKFL